MFEKSIAIKIFIIKNFKELLMAFKLSKITKLIAEDIFQKRTIASKNGKPEENPVFIIKRYNALKKKEYLRNTINILNNPSKIITLTQNKNKNALIKDFILPISSIIITKSILPRGLKYALSNKITNLQVKFSIKESELKQLQKPEKDFKLVA